ncbi:MAG: hypothetical protein WBO06_05945 [Gammaproteobacteria bacterium]
MIRYSFIIVLLAMLTACAAQQTTGSGNPANICRDKGLEVDSDAYKSCVAEATNNECIARGLQQGTDEFSKCQDEVRKATFTRQQLQMRGY